MKFRANTRFLKVALISILWAALAAGAQPGLQPKDISGLQNLLDIKATIGPAFLPGRAAVISSAGFLEAVVGNMSDCVRVDGTAGPCGATSYISTGGNTFVDNETPSGSLDGKNAQFLLGKPPTPSSSLALFDNGLLMRNGSDYDLAANTVIFRTCCIPKTSDVLTASYRTLSDARGVSKISAGEGESPDFIQRLINIEAIREVTMPISSASKQARVLTQDIASEPQITRPFRSLRMLQQTTTLGRTTPTPPDAASNGFKQLLKALVTRKTDSFPSSGDELPAADERQSGRFSSMQPSSYEPGGKHPVTEDSINTIGFADSDSLEQRSPPPFKGSDRIPSSLKLLVKQLSERR